MLSPRVREVMTKPVVASLRGVSREYGHGESLVRALRDIDLSLPRGDFVVFLGPSGSGKTTLLNVIGGIETATRGEVMVDGQRIDKLDRKALTGYRRDKIGFIFQFFNLIPSLTAQENVEMAARLSPDSMPSNEALERVGMGGRMDHFPAQLSGGEQQRVAIARAVVRKPAILLADEPTGELDDENGRRVLSLLREMNRGSDTTVLLVTHNSAIATMADRVVRMHSGTVASVEENKAPVEANTLRW
jgi:putative ABC transport system ATP-binding protein